MTTKKKNASEMAQQFKTLLLLERMQVQFPEPTSYSS